MLPLVLLVAPGATSCWGLAPYEQTIVKPYCCLLRDSHGAALIAWQLTVECSDCCAVCVDLSCCVAVSEVIDAQWWSLCGLLAGNSSEHVAVIDSRVLQESLLA